MRLMYEVKDIPGYEGLYQANSVGEIISLHNNRQKVLRPAIHKNGYMFVHLRKDKKSKCCRVHRLVALALIANPDNKSDVNHLDGDKSNNHKLNLVWATKSENNQHAYDTGLREVGELHHNSKLTEEMVRYIRTAPVSVVRVAKQLGISSTVAWKARVGKTWRHVT